MNQRKPGARTTRRLSTWLPTENAGWLEEALGFTAIAPAVRALVSSVQSYGHLPAPVVARLKKDALALNLNPLEYLQLLLHQRYVQLIAQDRRKNLR